MDTDINTHGGGTPFYSTKLGKLLPFLKGNHVRLVTKVFTEQSGVIRLRDDYDIIESPHLANRVIDVILKDMSDYYWSLIADNKIDSDDKKYHHITISHRVAAVLDVLPCQSQKIINSHILNSTEYIDQELCGHLRQTLNCDDWA